MRQPHFLLLLMMLFGPFLALGQKKERKPKNADAVPAGEYEKGTLTEGRPTGIWEYYDQQGELTLRMNYDSSRIAYSRPDTAGYLLYTNDDWQEVRPSRAPQYMGSRAKRTAAMSKAIRYPTTALQQETQGKVIISYVVNEQGQTQDYEVVASPSKDCTDAVWTVLKQQPDRWIPAVYQGQPTRAKFFLRVDFAMVDSREAAAYEARSQQEDQQPHPPYIDQVRITAVGVERAVRSVRSTQLGQPMGRPGQRAQMPR